jgi:hypothetical protein
MLPSKCHRGKSCRVRFETQVKAHAQTPYFRVPRSTYTSVPSTNALLSGRTYISNSFSSTYICSSFEKKRSNLPTVAALASLRPVYSANRPQKTSGFQEVQAIRAYARSGGMPMQGITAPATTSSAGGVRLKPYMQSPMVTPFPSTLAVSVRSQCLAFCAKLLLTHSANVVSTTGLPPTSGRAFRYDYFPCFKSK